MKTLFFAIAFVLSININAQEGISLIKTQHSAGNNILKGAVIGGFVFTLLGVATADPDA
jgi:hypothetical protein